MISSKNTDQICPICTNAAAPLMTIKNINFFICSICDLRFKHPAHFLSQDDEKTHYDHHKNDAHDEGYRKFLSKLKTPLSLELLKGATVLDFGAGPVANGHIPALTMMMREHGFKATFYDPIYHDDRGCLAQVYDAVIATEVIEHFHYPREMFDQLYQLIRPNGWLAVMTAIYDNTTDFATWHYHRDPTHVAFYSETTLTWIKQHYGFILLRPHKNVALFQKAFSFKDNSART